MNRYSFFIGLGVFCACLSGCQQSSRTSAERGAANAWAELGVAVEEGDRFMINQLITVEAREKICAMLDCQGETDRCLKMFIGKGEKLHWEEMSPGMVHGVLPPWDSAVVFRKNGRWRLVDYIPGE